MGTYSVGRGTLDCEGDESCLLQVEAFLGPKTADDMVKPKVSATSHQRTFQKPLLKLYMRKVF